MKTQRQKNRNRKEKNEMRLQLQYHNQTHNDCRNLYGLMEIGTMLTKENPTKIRNNNDNTNIYRNINDAIYDKTVVHVLPTNPCWGFGDYLRGSISIAYYAKFFGIKFAMDMNANPISEYFVNNCEDNPPTNKIFYFDNNKYHDIYLLFIKFMNSNEKKLYVTTNLLYNTKLPSQDIKDIINYFIQIKPDYYTVVDQLINLQNYNVIHIRCSDNCFDDKITAKGLKILFDEILNLQLSCDTVIISNNYWLKKILNKKFGFHFIDKKPIHSASVSNSSELETTIIDYIILSRSTSTYCFTHYMHGSGFSEHCSVLNNIPYKVTLVDI